MRAFQGHWEKEYKKERKDRMKERKEKKRKECKKGRKKGKQERMGNKGMFCLRMKTGSSSMWGIKRAQRFKARKLCLGVEGCWRVTYPVSGYVTYHDLQK